MGIEPTLVAWEATVLPLNYTRTAVRLDGRDFTQATALTPSMRAWTRSVTMADFIVAPIMTSTDSPRLRSIRSFVIRAGRMTDGQARALVELWPKYGVSYEPMQINLDLTFGRSAPRMLEIGFGAGEALLAFAQAHPEMDCLGIEVHRPGAGSLMLNVENAGLSNVRVSTHDAVEVLQHQLQSASLDRVHIFFPDPWHKKRHHKRRLIQQPFIDLLARVVKPGGMVRLATDWEDYAQQMLSVLNAHTAFKNVSSDASFVPRTDDRPLTRFEQRGHRLGHGVWDLAYVRVEA
jgi:tRNA (guanine-N7-)-methyltransferase